MKYTREIDNNIMIQYIILYTLAEADRHVTYRQLTELIFDNCNIEFTNFQPALVNLEETGHLRSFLIDDLTAVYELLPKGRDANKFFMKNIPIYIREPISEAIPKFSNEEEKRKSIKAELLPVGRREFAAKCGIYDRNVPLLEMTVYAGSRDDANKLLRRFRENTEEIYRSVISIMNDGGC